MFFLLRMAFWLTVILALLPAFVTHDEPQTQSAAAKFNAGDAVSAATATVSDLSQFCTRRPETCAIGAQAAAAVGASAQTGVKILYGYLQDKAGETNAAPKAANATAANRNKSLHDRTASAKAGRDTLQPTDIAPAWRGPSARQDAASDRQS